MNISIIAYNFINQRLLENIYKTVMAPFILLHLGAGKQKKHFKYKQLIEDACSVASEKKSSIVDHVENCIRILEDSGIVNCGMGSVNDTADALIIYKHFGSITQTTTKNPISVARFLMEQPRIKNGKMTPILISGDNYIVKSGLYVKKRYATVKPQEMNDTVGCIAFDNGEFCVGTSSGGIQLKDSGRIGSSFMYGVGGFIKYSIKKTIAITSSGAGEQIILSDFCRSLVQTFSETVDYLDALKLQMELFVTNPILSGFPCKYIGILVAIYENNHLEFLYAHSTPTFFFGYSYNLRTNTIFSSLKSNQLYSYGNFSVF